jgi:hypothetical protein
VTPSYQEHDLKNVRGHAVAELLDWSVRALVDMWPAAVFEDLNGIVYSSYGKIQHRDNG